MNGARQTVCLFVNGILTVPGDADNWTGKAVTWTHLHTPFRAEKIEYLSGATLGRLLGQRRRAERLAHTLRFYVARGWRIVLAGHSNGCDVILDALHAMGWPRIAELHLISAACEADFSRNGLNAAALAGRVGGVTVYVAERDWALKLAATATGRLLGYGTLGKTGPVNAEAAVEIVRRDFGHGGWFSESELPATLNRITRAREGHHAGA
ncbi:MAG TPA: hypothetical protein VD994_01785 [Prosthecobacter sp.]|nr:hypothetical protein [Prosthecobacter sp.]